MDYTKKHIYHAANAACAACFAVTIWLFTRPYAIAMRFSDGENIHLHYCSYFDFLPLGYGDFLLIMSALSTILSAFVFLYGTSTVKNPMYAIYLTAFSLFLSVVIALTHHLSFVPITALVLLALSFALQCVGRHIRKPGDSQ